jgi:hypothetical protein
MNRGFLNWGVFLVVLGAVPLAVQVGLIEASAVRELWRLWPLILIGLGIGLILRLTRVGWLGGVIVAATLGLLLGSLLAGGVRGISSACVGTGAGGEQSTQSGEAGAGRFAAQIELTCGELVVSRVPGNTWTVVAHHAAGQGPAIAASPSRLEVGSDVNGPVPFFGQERRDWTVTLPIESELTMGMTLNAANGQVALGGGALESMSATLNASDARIDLSDAAMTGFASTSLTLNASSGTLLLPAQSMTGSITLNASSLDLCIAPEAGVRIEHNGTLSSADFAPAGLSRSDDQWETPGFDAAASQLRLEISTTLSSVTLDRSGDCP